MSTPPLAAVGTPSQSVGQITLFPQRTAAARVRALGGYRPGMLHQDGFVSLIFTQASPGSDAER
ncbi:hypothetical protein [Actinocrispum wychmicini]|uniref:Uncharacterized protein n=1 Tax=Actinocrispum wychmicini TaxID=1213861 RepID=A0A4R2IIB2_9PSEU|nr:hypothetical protein [Actinocrispum wychmicini]TCO44721.1 hypothetical protein EV192_12342 [Actinocrispum wychmicini]